VKIPEAVIVHTDTGHTVSNDMAGNPLTVAEAQALAREYNDACKPEHRNARVYRLEPVDRWRQPAWLHERNNDPYGTPNKHEFWSGPIGCLAERVGAYKIFVTGGFWYAYDTQHNAWLHFDSEAACREHAAKPPIDPWA
jgi:hypothetical protein